MVIQPEQYLKFVLRSTCAVHLIQMLDMLRNNLIISLFMIVLSKC